MQTANKPTMVLVGGIARSGNHLLRGLLDGVTTLAVPPDEDFFARTLARSRRNLWRAWHCRTENVVSFYRKMQKDGHFERLNAGASEDSPNQRDLLDLEKYYARVQEEFQRFSLQHVCEAHFLGLRYALRNSDKLHDPIRVSACPLIPNEDDFTNVCRLLSRFYTVKALLIYRDPLATYASGKIRKYFGGIERFCDAVEWFPEQVRTAKDQFEVDVLPIAFGEMLQHTEQVMRCVAAFIGIPFVAQMLTCTQYGVAVESNSSFQRTTAVDRKRTNSAGPEAVGKVLERDEIELIQRRCGQFVGAMRGVSFG